MKRKKLNFPLLVFFVFLLLIFSNGSTIDEVAQTTDYIYEQILTNALQKNDMVALENFLKITDDKEKQHFRQFLLEYTIQDKVHGNITILHEAIHKNNRKFAEKILHFFPQKTEEKNLIKFLKRKGGVHQFNAIRHGFRSASTENLIWETLFKKFPDQPDELSKLLLEEDEYGGSIFEDVTFQDINSKKLKIVLKKFPETKYADLANFLLKTKKPFSYILSHGSEESIKLILSIVKNNKPKEYIELFFKEGILDSAKRNKYHDKNVVKILLEEFPKTSNEEKFIEFINTGDKLHTLQGHAIVKMLLKYLPKNNTQFFYEKKCGPHEQRDSILSSAARKNDAELVKMLLDKFAEDHDDEEMIHFLMQEGKSLDWSTHCENGKILEIIFNAFPKQNNKKVIKFLRTRIGFFKRSLLLTALSRKTIKNIKLIFDMFPLNEHNAQELCSLVLQKDTSGPSIIRTSPLHYAPNEIVNLLIQKINDTEIEKKEKKKILWVIINCILNNLKENVALALSKASIVSLIEIDPLFAIANKTHFEENALDAFRNIRLASLSLWMKKQQQKKGIYVKF